MTNRPFRQVDVFGSRDFSGNPLAVVLDAEGLSDDDLRRISVWTNLSECTFVLPPTTPDADYRVRIFSLANELPFAGHPTVGTAVLLAHERLQGIERETDAMVVLEEQVGVVRCGVTISPQRSGRAVFDLPKLPEERPFHGDVGLAASALGLNRGDIGFENHVPCVFDGGGPVFVFLPLAGLDAMRRIRVDKSLWASAFGSAELDLFVYTREVVTNGHDFHARMFAPHLGIGEDPATGSAAAAFSAVVRRFDRPADGEHQLIIEQGFEMGRPSRIELEIIIEKGKLTGGRIGGEAVIVGRGELYV